MDSRRDDAPASGAVAAGGERRRKRAIWPWLLGLLALLLLGGLLAALTGGDDDGERAATNGQQTGQDDARGVPSGSGAETGGITGEAESGEAGGAEVGGDETGGTAAGDAGTLTARNDDILAAPAGGLGSYVGEQATGRDVVVQSVVQSADDPNQLEGFFVGSSEQDRTYVEWGGEVGANEADFQPEVGQKVNLEGPVRPAPQDPAKVLKLGADDARVVTEQGGFVNADQVSPAG